MISTDQAKHLLNGGTVIGSDGQKIGGVGEIYLDDETGAPEWVTVATGLFGRSQSFIPLAKAEVAGEEIRVPYGKDKVKDAPRIDGDGSLSPDEEAELYAFYGLGHSAAHSDSGLPAAPRGTSDATRTSETTDTFDTPRGAVGHDTSGPTTDEAMTRSEEQLKVGTERQEVGRARLRKYVVSEHQTVHVPVEREEVRVVTEPITDGNLGRATEGPALSEEQHEVVLHAERAVVDKEAVPVERVRLETDTVTSNETVSEEVRTERIDSDGVDGVAAVDRPVEMRAERNTTEARR